METSMVKQMTQNVDVLGLDPSWGSFGFCRLKSKQEDIAQPWAISLAGTCSLNRKYKDVALADLKRNLFNPSFWVPEEVGKSSRLILIEDYSYGIQNTNCLTAMGELRTLVELAISDLSRPKLIPPIYYISPTALKKFATGKGNTQKSIVMQQVLKRWGFEAKNDDIADAFVLAQIGLALGGVGVDTLNQAQLEVIAKITDAHKI